MKKKITIKVTQKDIKNGTPDDRSFCPIARATRRAARVRHVGVEAGHLLWGSGDELMYAPLPPAARKFVRDFDNGKPVKPFSFEVTGE